MKQYQILSNGKKLPLIGFGTWHLTGNEGTEVIKNAIKMGFRVIDTAQAYENETEVGKAINECIKEGIVKREELFISSKINPHFPIGYDEAIKAVESTLKKMQLDYIDLYMIHWPNMVEDDSWKKLNADTWRGFEKMVEKGKLRQIGVSNFMIHHLEELLKTAKIKPVINQLNLNPTWQQKEVVAFCQHQGIVLQAWAPLIRVRKWNEKILTDVASKYDKSIQQICLRWSIQKGFLPLTKTHSIDRMRENLKIFDFEIQPKDMELLDNLNSHPWNHDSQPDCLYEIFKLREMISQKYTFSSGYFKFLGIKFLKVFPYPKGIKVKLLGIPFLKIKKSGKSKYKLYLFNFIKISSLHVSYKFSFTKQLPTYEEGAHV